MVFTFYLQFFTSPIYCGFHLIFSLSRLSSFTFSLFLVYSRYHYLFSQSVSRLYSLLTSFHLFFESSLLFLFLLLLSFSPYLTSFSFVIGHRSLLQETPFVHFYYLKLSRFVNLKIIWFKAVLKSNQQFPPKSLSPHHRPSNWRKTEIFNLRNISA